MSPPQPINGGQFRLDHAMWSLGEWIAQPKWDGWRAIVTRSGAYTRQGKRLPRAESWEDKLLPILDEVEWLDCELLGPRDQGDDTLIVFDASTGGDWETRRIYLESKLEVCGVDRPASGVWLTPYSTRPAEMWHAAKLAGAEGIVAKRPCSRYGSSRAPYWVKFRFADQINDVH